MGDPPCCPAHLPGCACACPGPRHRRCQDPPDCHQPIVHETRTHTVQQVNHVSAAPVAVAHHAVAAAAPIAAVHSAAVAAPAVAAVHSAGHVVGAVNGLALHGAALVNGAHGLIHA